MQVAAPPPLPPRVAPLIAIPRAILRPQRPPHPHTSPRNQIDGSVRCACINAASMALITAGVEMRDTVCACSAGILDTTIVADLTQSEENACVTPASSSPRAVRTCLVASRDFHAAPLVTRACSCDGHIIVASMPKSSFICHVNSGPKVTVDRFFGVLQVRARVRCSRPGLHTICHTLSALQAATEGCSKLGASFRVELLQLTSRLIQLQVLRVFARAPAADVCDENFRMCKRESDGVNAAA